MSLVLGCCREIISNGPPRFHQGGGGGGGGGGDVSSNNKRSLMMISSSIEKQNDNRHLSCFSVDPTDFNSSASDKSSIGGDSDDDDLDDECVSSNVKFSMDSLEESLPIKRGLSNYFSGRSKSFANLSEATSVRSLAKTENPFNKRRRTLMACRRNSSRRKAFYSSSCSTRTIISPVSMPLLKLNEDDDEENQTETDDDDDDDDDEQVKMKMNSSSNKETEVELTQIQQHQHGRIKRFKAPRCFSLTDLHHHHHQ